MSRDAILSQVNAFFTAKLREHGPGHLGMDWNSQESQYMRFEQLMRLVDGQDDFSLLDYGCGTGALLDYLADRKTKMRYTGFDISAAMISEATRLHPATTRCSFTTQENELLAADYAVASGIFNMKQQTADDRWRAYMEHTVDEMNRLSSRGFAFNVLTLYSDVEKRRPDLYYADPLYWFDLCKRRYSPRVALLHDYPAWEFTLLVRKEGK
ncbi:MAG: class I SAM-dependent methyltransferase [Tepidisphaeraceae bacterium]